MVGILHHDEGVDLIPANLELSAMEFNLVNAMSRETALRNYLTEVKDKYDYILIDCMPSLGMVTINALSAADSVIIPVQAQYLPAKGMSVLEQGYKNSLLVLAAYENDELLGIIRVVGDGFTIIFVQDILVFPREQRKGVGTALMKAVLNRYPDVRQIELATDNTSKTVAFYKSLGFTEFSEMGCCGFMRC